MKIAGYPVFLLLIVVILLPRVAQSQSNSLRNDPVYQAARKAQQEGRIADAEKILNDRIHAIGEATQPNSVELVPYLNLLVGIDFVKQPRADTLAMYERILEIDRAAYGAGDYRSLRDLMNVAGFSGTTRSRIK